MDDLAELQQEYGIIRHNNDLLSDDNKALRAKLTEATQAAEVMELALKVAGDEFSYQLAEARKPDCRTCIRWLQCNDVLFLHRQQIDCKAGKRYDRCNPVRLYEKEGKE